MAEKSQPATKPQYKKTGRKYIPRLEGWGKETVLKEIREGAVVMDICAKYALTNPPTSLYQEIVRWRHQDPAFEKEWTAIMLERDPDRNSKSRGAPRKEDIDPSLADWRLKFCQDLFETGKKLEAARRSPFCWEEIVKKLNKTTPSYDQQFAEMVHEVQMKLCAEMEGGFVEAFRESSGRDKAWIARSWLERQDPERWSRQVEMIHSGQVVHKHEIQVSRESRLAALADEQSRFFSKHSPAPALAAGDEEAIEVEVLSATEVR
jgi:hypothetical protein